MNLHTFKFSTLLRGNSKPFLRYVILALGLLGVMTPSFTQDISVNAKSSFKIDSNYIEDFSDLLVVRGFVKQKANELKIEDIKSNRSVLLRPHVTSSIGGGFNYRWLGIDLAFRLPSSDQDNAIYGKTKAFDFQANMYLRKFSIDVQYLNYRGYYIDNSTDYGQDEGKITNESLGSGLIAISGNYIFNHKRFSYRAAFLQNERQKKSAGSFILGLYASHNFLKSDSAIIPKDYWKYFGREALINKGTFTQLGIQCGYAFSIVYKNFYVTSSFGLGIGSQTTRTESVFIEQTMTSHQLSSKAQLRVAVGYNGDRFSCGVQGVNDTIILTGKENVRTKYDVGSIRIFVSYRLKPPKLLKKFSELIKI